MFFSPEEFALWSIWAGRRQPSSLRGAHERSVTSRATAGTAALPAAASPVELERGVSIKPNRGGWGMHSYWPSSCWVSGMLFDKAHCFSNAIFSADGKPQFAGS